VGLAISVFPISDSVDRNGAFGLIEEDAVIADTKPVQSLELATERFNLAFPRLGISVDGL
jgi:hypothetical protein